MEVGRGETEKKQRKFNGAKKDLMLKKIKAT